MRLVIAFTQSIECVRYSLNDTLQTQFKGIGEKQHVYSYIYLYLSITGILTSIEKRGKIWKMGGMTCVLILMLELLLTVLIVQGQPSLSIEPATWYTGTNLTVSCNLTGITTSGVNFFKGTDQIYTCVLTHTPCSDKYGVSDYSDIDWSQTGKAVFTISKADSTRDDGDWTCSGDDITQKSKKTSLSITDRPSFGLRGLEPNRQSLELRGLESISETNDGKEKLFFIVVVIPLVALLIVFFIVTRDKKLGISTLNLKETKNTFELSWKPEFEPVPNTTYAKCAQNGLTENAEFTNGSVVIEFQNLTPERKHDVTIYCQNQADMKLYKSETFVVSTLKDSSNTNPKERKTVLSLH